MSPTTTKPRRRAAAAKPAIAEVTPADFQRVITFLDTQVLVERSNELRVLLLGLLSGVNVHQLGGSGIAKSLGLRELARCIPDAKYFEKPLNAGLPPDAVIGPYDMALFARTGLFERKVEGYAPTADIIFLDEEFRSNGLMQDALLPISNTTERHAEINGGMMECPTKLLVSASNHMPDPDNDQARALVDRITLMSYVEDVKSDESFMEIIRRDHVRRTSLKAGTFKRETITLAQVEQAQAEVQLIVPSTDFLVKAAELRRNARDAGLSVSSRRWVELGYVCRGLAWLSGRDHLVAEDLKACEDGMWRELDEIAIAHKLVLPFHGRFEREAAKFQQEAAKPLAEMEELRPLVEGVPPTSELPPKVLTKALGASRGIQVAKARVDKVLAEAEAAQSDASSLRELSNTLLAQLLWLKQNHLPHGMD